MNIGNYAYNSAGELAVITSSSIFGYNGRMVDGRRWRSKNPTDRGLSQSVLALIFAAAEWAKAYSNPTGTSISEYADRNEKLLGAIRSII